MRILITGGNGFLGSQIVRKLIDSHQVYVISKNYNNLIDIKNKIQYTSLDLSEYRKLKKQLDDFSPEIIIHCAWSGGNSYVDINNIEQFNNLRYSVDLLELFLTASYKPKFVGLGSFSEYGNHKNVITELTPTNPIDLYGVSKLSFKLYSETICNQHGLDWVWIRPCYIYGPRDVSTRFLPKLINKIIDKEEIVLDECNKTIDYLYITDFVNAVTELIFKKSTGVFNLCSGKKYKMKDLINLTFELMGESTNIKYDSNLNRNTLSSFICGDPSKIQEHTKIKPKVTIENGISALINYIKMTK